MNCTRSRLPFLLRLLTLLLLLPAACGDEQTAAATEPTVPPPVLAPFLPTLKELSAAMPMPDDRTQRELKELADIVLDLVPADSRTKARAERSLLEHPEVWFALQPHLAHDDVAVRRRTAWLCGRTEATELQLPLLLRLKYESDPEAIVWLADSLQRLGNDAGLTWLGSAMNREATAQVAGQLAIEIGSERGIEFGESPTYVELQEAMQTLTAKWRQEGIGGRPDVKQPSGKGLDARLATQLATTESTLLRPIDDARYILTRAGILALPLLERTLTASEHYLRTMALQVLAEIGPCAATKAPAVRQLLGDPLTSSYAVRTLGEIGDTEALPFLRPMLDSIDTELRAAATQALGLLRDENSRAALLARMQDGNETMDVRVGAAFALRCLGEHVAAEAFLVEREQKADYHAPTLARLRERLQQLGR